jgi:hypothetical protein
VTLGTVPFAALAWTSIVPLLLAVEAFAIAAVITAGRRAAPMLDPDKQVSS